VGNKDPVKVKVRRPDNYKIEKSARVKGKDDVGSMD
jgi:hypothetical protein